jgi:hypothetical protein
VTFFYFLAEITRPLGNGSEIPGVQQLLIDKLPSNADHFTPGADEICCVTHFHTAHRRQLHLW